MHQSTKIDPNKKFSQVTEKFANIDFYTKIYTFELWIFDPQLEGRSLHISKRAKDPQFDAG